MAEEDVSILQGHFFVEKIAFDAFRHEQPETNATSAFAIMKRAKLRVSTNSKLFEI